MPSTLLSTSCFINTEPYKLRICIDDDSNEFSVSNIDDILSTSSAERILDSIQFQFESLIDKKKNSSDNDDDAIPEIIILSKLFSIKPNVKLSNESTLSESSQVELSYVDISELFIWSVKRLQLEVDSTVAQQLCLISNRCLSKLKHRPRHLLVFINPECGNGKRMQNFVPSEYT
jgi:hypothetical protein